MSNIKERLANARSDLRDAVVNREVDGDMSESAADLIAILVDALCCATALIEDAELNRQYPARYHDLENILGIEVLNHCVKNGRDELEADTDTDSRQSPRLNQFRTGREYQQLRGKLGHLEAAPIILADAILAATDVLNRAGLPGEFVALVVRQPKGFDNELARTLVTGLASASTRGYTDPETLAKVLAKGVKQASDGAMVEKHCGPKLSPE